MTNDEMKAIVALVTYKPGWRILFGEDASDGNRAYIQVEVDESTEAAIHAHRKDGYREGWRGGKRSLSKWMCYQEVVGACFGAIHDAEMHELREWFRFDSASIYNPHLDPRVLVAIAKLASSFNVRENAMVPD